MSKKCVSIVVAYNGLDLLRHYLRHYDRLGVDEMIICAGVKQTADMLKGKAEERKTNELPQLIEICKPYRTRIYPFTYEAYNSIDKLWVERHALAHYGIGLDDYVMWTDLDEFFSFPCPLSELIDAMNRRNDWAIHGWILDRVARDGSLPSIQPDISLEQQFPIGANITGAFLHANTRKIMLARGRVRVNEGHDNTENGYFHHVPVGVIHDYTAHHFRWTKELAGKVMERLLKPGNLSPLYIRECNTLLAYYRKHGRIDLKNPVFAAHDAKAIRYFK